MAMGRPRTFQTEDELWKAFEDYKEHVEKEKSKWETVQYVGRDGERVVDNPKIPLTMEGFKRFCYPTYGNIEQYFTNPDDRYADFVGICSHIRNEIREDQIVGGLLGFYNPSITQRLNGLKEQNEHTVVNKEIPLFPDVSKNDGDE